jgi:hypothetical protein
LIGKQLLKPPGEEFVPSSRQQGKDQKNEDRRFTNWSGNELEQFRSIHPANSPAIRLRQPDHHPIAALSDSDTGARANAISNG